MQIGLLDGAHDEEGVLATVGSLVERARAAGVALVYVQHDHVSYEPLQPGQATWEIHPQLAPRAGDHVVHKSASDAFYKTELASVLKTAGVNRLVVTGMQTEFCVDATVRAASSRGYDVVLVADGHTTGDTDLSAAQIIAHHNQTLGNLAQPDHPVTVSPAAEIVLSD